METEVSLKEIQDRILAGEQFTVDEYRRVIESVRGARKSASETSTKSRAPKAKADFDLFAEMNEVMGK